MSSRLFLFLVKVVPVSPFRLRRRIGPRPAFSGVDATAKTVGADPFVEPERRSPRSEESAVLPKFLLRCQKFFLLGNRPHETSQFASQGHDRFLR